MLLLIMSFAITLVWALAHFLRPEGLPIDAHCFFALYALACWTFWALFKILEYFCDKNKDTEDS